MEEVNVYVHDVCHYATRTMFSYANHFSYVQRHYQHLSYAKCYKV